jgi:hypothetical protein
MIPSETSTEVNETKNDPPTVPHPADAPIERRRVLMKKLVHSVIATTLCAVSVGIVAAPRAQAANPKVLYTGHLTEEPALLITGVDGAKNLDVSKTEQQLTEAFTGSDWNIMDNGTIVVTKNGKTVITLPFSIASEDLVVIFPHARTAASGVDGFLISDSSEGFFDLWITQPGTGGTFTFWIDGFRSTSERCPPSRPNSPGARRRIRWRALAVWAASPSLHGGSEAATITRSVRR